MKKIVIGCCLTTIGLFSNVLLFISASFHVNVVDGWSVPPGRIITVIENTGISLLILPIIISTIILFIGLYFLLKEYKKIS